MRLHIDRGFNNPTDEDPSVGAPVTRLDVAAGKDVALHPLGRPMLVGEIGSPTASHFAHVVWDATEAGI